MNRASRPALIAIALVSFVVTRMSTAADVTPLTNVHAHNDYEHPHPLFDAMAQGFCSFEADIHLVGGKLLVAHSRAAVKPDRTLQSLYLDPMKRLISENGGRLYRNGPPVWLLIDFKGDPREIYPVLRQVLEQYSAMFTTWREGKKTQGAVTAILTGNHPAESVLAAEKVRYAGIDGILEALDRNPPADLVPWMSSQWSLSFKWKGIGPFPDDERQKLRGLVEKAHSQGRLIRFWGAPDNVAAWKELLAAKVDLINTDDLKGVRTFLTSGPAGQR
jgi:glycerophosphoryl diester phosphodiesterase family protein